MNHVVCHIVSKLEIAIDDKAKDTMDVFSPGIFNFSYFSAKTYLRRLSLCLPLLIVALPSYGKLSTAALKPINGIQPNLALSDNTVLTDLNQVLGIRIPDGNGGMLLVDANQSTPITVLAGMKYSDVLALVTADGVSHSLAGVKVTDTDGDAEGGRGSASGSMLATWKKDGVVITDLNQTLSACDSSYTLTIDAENVSANTTYGIPRVHEYGNGSPKTYTFNAYGICYIEPKSMTVNAAVAPGNSKFPVTGYNPELWEDKKGFSIKKMVAAGKTFPTTGFYQAQFTLVGSGSDQSLFRCNTSDANLVLSTKTGKANNCTVTFNTETKPTAPMTVNMEYNDNGVWKQVDSYTIPVPKLWARAKGMHYYNTLATFGGTYNAAIACGAPTNVTRAEAGTYFFTRKEVTNAISADMPADTWVSNTSERSVRDLDGTFIGEWGFFRDYTGSGFDDTPTVWLGDSPNEEEQFLVHASYGYVRAIYPTVRTTIAMCRG